jgi:hypothetical protein
MKKIILISKQRKREDGELIPQFFTQEEIFLPYFTDTLDKMIIFYKFSSNWVHPFC